MVGTANGRVNVTRMQERLVELGSRVADRVEPAGLAYRWPARGAGGFAMGADGADSGR